VGRRKEDRGEAREAYRGVTSLLYLAGGTLCRAMFYPDTRRMAAHRVGQTTCWATTRHLHARTTRRWCRGPGELPACACNSTCTYMPCGCYPRASMPQNISYKHHSPSCARWMTYVFRHYTSFGRPSRTRVERWRALRYSPQLSSNQNVCISSERRRATAGTSARV